MNKTAFVTGFLLSLLFLRGRVAAMTYTDNMSDMDRNTIKTYSNLQPISAVPGYPSATLSAIPGRNALTFANTAQPVGYAQYRIEGAQTVTVELYTRYGTFASYVPEFDSYALGAYTLDKNQLGTAPLIQCLYSTDTGGIYARINGALCRPVDITFFQEFRPAGSPGNLIDYGVNVYAGSSPAALSRVSLSSGSQQRLAAMQIHAGFAYVQETLQYQLPASARYVRVEINDYTFLEKEMPNGEISRMPVNTSMRATLSSVTFEGNTLVLGEPEPVQSESVPSSSASESSGQRSSSSSSSRAREGAATSSGSSSNSAKSSQSKFEGEILADPPATSSRKAGGGGESAAAEESQLPPQEESWESGEEPTRVEVFRLEPQGGGAMAGGVILYIAVVGALILLLLLRGKGK